MTGAASAAARPLLLLGPRMPRDFVVRLATRFEVVGPLVPPFPDSVAALSPHDAQRACALITMGAVGASRGAITGLPALRLICCLGSGFERVDLAAARERGIAVTHSPGANAAAVADLAVTLMLASIRQVFAANAFLRRGDWTGNASRRPPLVRGVTGRRVGIFGLGAIGEKIARRVAAFEADVGYHNRNRRNDVPYAYFASLRELAEWADVLVIAVRADAANRHAVDAGILAALGPDGHVVNIARGSVIDEAALIRALRDGAIAGAGLDVFEREPVVPPELTELSNATLTPHIGGGTREAQAAMQDMVWANLEAFLDGRCLPTPVAPDLDVVRPALAAPDREGSPCA